ncbi:MAG: HAD-IA family hydrolase [Pseudomonadota bacterium]
MAPRPCIIFDCDGTLTDSHHVIVEAMTRTFVSAGLTPPTDPATRAVIGLSLPNAIGHLLQDGELGLRDQLVEDYKTVFSEMRLAGEMREHLFPHVKTCLDALLDAGASLGIATGKSRRGLDHILDTHGLRRYFGTLQTADTNPSKPHPAMLEVAMSELGAAPHETVMIGDSPYDIQMARAAGTRAIGVSWTDHGPAALKAAGAHALLDSFDDWSVLLSEDKAA